MAAGRVKPTGKWDSARVYWSRRKNHPDAKFLMSRAWRDGIREQQLNKQPLCEFCLLLGQVKAAAQVDHRRVPNGDSDLQRDADNLRSICAEHHGMKTRAQGKGKLRLGVRPDGWPIEVDTVTGEVIGG